MINFLGIGAVPIAGIATAGTAILITQTLRTRMSAGMRESSFTA